MYAPVCTSVVCVVGLQAGKNVYSFKSSNNPLAHNLQFVMQDSNILYIRTHLTLKTKQIIKLLVKSRSDMLIADYGRDQVWLSA